MVTPDDLARAEAVPSSPGRGNTRSSAARTSGRAAKDLLALVCGSSHSKKAIVARLVFQKSCRAVIE